jgi:hypothetical protein
MNRLESQWIGERLNALPNDAIFPMLNVGSSTLDFRVNTQPYIEENIFAPLRARGGRVYHLDIKSAPGVDLVGDLLDPAFIKRIIELNIRSAMLSNFLEHVTLRQQFCDAVMQILPSGGYLVVSGPHKYPYHADPIDTMFRPTLEEMHAHFPGTTIIDRAIINSGNWRQWDPAERGRPLGWSVARLLAPFYRPDKWWELARQSPYIFKRISAVALLLRKESIKYPQ